MLLDSTYLDEALVRSEFHTCTHHRRHVRLPPPRSRLRLGSPRLGRSLSRKKGLRDWNDAALRLL